jgi:RNA polymerase sigma-70 factor (ECF subfamily)
MMVVWERASTFNHTSRLSTWILGIGYRKYLEWQRREARSRKLFRRARREREEDDEEPSPDLDLEDEVHRKLRREELIQRVKEAVEELAEEHRLVVELTFQQGLSYREIARILSIKPGTVKSRMFYAKQRLKEILTRKGMEGDELWQISKGT